MSALAARAADPRGLAAGVRSLLDDYADRTHRSSPRLAGRALDRTFKTPAPVVRAIVNALRGPLRDLAAGGGATAALDALDRVWAGGSLEEQRIAAELLGQVAPLAPEPALALVRNWLTTLDSGATADHLAEHGLGPVIRANPGPYLALARDWATSPQRWTRRFALSMLWPLARDRQWDNVPGALAVLRMVMGEPDGEVRRAAAAVLQALGPKSPMELASFLREQAARPNSYTHWIVRAALPGLPPADQAEVLKILRQ
jgi:hypothetical protein